MPLRPRPRGCLFLWLLSFGQAKESNRRPGMVDETHTDVSRFSRRRREPKSKAKWIPALRRDDEPGGFHRNGGRGKWIPAFAGMTPRVAETPSAETSAK